MRFYCFQYSLFHIHICILSQRSPDFHVFSVILVLRKNAVPADASAAAITLPPQPAWRGSVLTAVVNGVACPLLWRVWRHGASGAVACLVLWCICAVTHLAQRRTWHSGAFGTAARLAQRRAWRCGAYGKIRQFPPTAPNRPPFRVFGSVLHRFEPVSRRLSKMILPLAKM